MDRIELEDKYLRLLEETFVRLVRTDEERRVITVIFGCNNT